MQDRFVGDIGDFGKYGLLRARRGIHPPADPCLNLGLSPTARLSNGRRPATALL